VRVLFASASERRCHRGNDRRETAGRLEARTQNSEGATRFGAAARLRLRPNSQRMDCRVAYPERQRRTAHLSRSRMGRAHAARRNRKAPPFTRRDGSAAKHFPRKDRSVSADRLRLERNSAHARMGRSHVHCGARDVARHLCGDRNFGLDQKAVARLRLALARRFDNSNEMQTDTRFGHWFSLKS